MTPDDVAQEQAKLRAWLRQQGWGAWREQHVRIADRLEHAAHVFTPQAPEGPLVVWEHPAGCACAVPLV